MKVLYVVLNDLGRKDSGSGVRPNCMLQAFRERGHELYVLSGSQDFDHAKSRKEAVEKALEWLKDNRPDFCYIESSTYPILNHCDYQLIRYLHKEKIPSSYFYRDIYRMLPGQAVDMRKGWKNRLKDRALHLLQLHTDRMLHKLDVVYFPGQGYADYFHYKRTELLPPGGDVKFIPEHPCTKTCIYVGGLSDYYGYPLMMEAFRLLNAGEETYKLILVCREEEYKKHCSGKELPDWLEVHHASGDALVPLYARADAGLLALSYNEYGHLCIGIKLFQYLSYGLPVVSTNVKTMGAIIRENEFGVVAEPNAQDYAEAIRKLLNEEQLRSYRRKIEDSLSQRHLWVHRVDKIVEDMTGVRPE